MGKVKLPPPVLLTAAICYTDVKYAEQALAMMSEKYGAISERSEPFDFCHTDYYRTEMGSDLKKFFCAFAHLIDPIDIVDIKLYTNQLEQQFADHNQRRINIDPGYLEAAKLILATTKNFSHRIYLGKGIYGDVQLYWRHGGFCCNEWTYPDYREPRTLAFFTQLRRIYLSKGELLCPLPMEQQA